MHLLRNLIVLVILCLILGAPAASAAERPCVPVGREVSGMARILHNIQAFLKAAWENEAGEIDPLPGNGQPPQEDPSNPSGDEAGYIDPLG